MAKKAANETQSDVATVTPERKALTTLQASKFLVLRPESDLAEAMAANIPDGEEITESSLTRVKTPSGGALAWEVDELEGTKNVDKITGALVFFHRAGVLWPTTDPVPGTLPLLRTDDLRTAYIVGEDYGNIDKTELEQYKIDDGLYDWKNLPWNQFGTGKNGNGKRCEESRTMCVLREGDIFPLLIRAKPGSLRTVVPFIQKLTIPYWRVIIELSLSKQISRGKQEYSRIEPRLAGELSREEGAQVRLLYTDRMSESVGAPTVESRGDED